jgi:hypothetical protein
MGRNAGSLCWRWCSVALIYRFYARGSFRPVLNDLASCPAPTQLPKCKDNIQARFDYAYAVQEACICYSASAMDVAAVGSGDLDGRDERGSEEHSRQITCIAKAFRKSTPVRTTTWLAYCQDDTHRLQGDTANRTRLATRNETMPSTEAPVSDIARRRESRPGC